MCHSANANELLEVPGHELRPVVRDDPGTLPGEMLARPLDDRFDLRLFHSRADLPVHDVPAVALEQRAQEVERAGDVDVGDIDVPVFVRSGGLHKARSFEGWFAVVTTHQDRESV